MKEICITQKRWFVLRDLKRSNANDPAYKVLPEISNGTIEVFTPMVKKPIQKMGKEVIVDRPFITDLLFVHASKQELDPIIRRIGTLQYRYVKGRSIHDPMVVDDEEMERFMNIVNSNENFQYYTMAEVSPELYGKKIRIVGGTLNGYTGRLMSKRGSKRRGLIVDLGQTISVAVEVNPEYIIVEK